MINIKIDILIWKIHHVQVHFVLLNGTSMQDCVILIFVVIHYEKMVHYYKVAHRVIIAKLVLYIVKANKLNRHRSKNIFTPLSIVNQMDNSLSKSLFQKYKTLSNSDWKKDEHKKDQNDNDTDNDSAIMGSVKSIQDSCELFVKQTLLAKYFFVFRY